MVVSVRWSISEERVAFMSSFYIREDSSFYWLGTLSSDMGEVGLWCFGMVMR